MSALSQRSCETAWQLRFKFQFASRLVWGLRRFETIFAERSPALPGFRENSLWRKLLSQIRLGFRVPQQFPLSHQVSLLVVFSSCSLMFLQGAYGQDSTPGTAEEPAEVLVKKEAPTEEKKSADPKPAEASSTETEQSDAKASEAKPTPAQPAEAKTSTAVQVPKKSGSEDGTANESTDRLKAAAPKPQKSLQDKLQEELLGQAKSQLVNPVESILERMRNVQDRLDKTSTDKETRQEQAKIVSEIDRLIEALKNQKPPPPQNSDSNQGQPPPPMGNQPDENQPARGTPQPRPQNSQKPQGQKPEQKETPQNGSGKQKAGQHESVSDKARESNSSTTKRPRSAEEEAARQRLAKDVWGHLPATLRMELLNIFSEKYIPKYDDQVRRYYEALAEQNRGDQ